MTPVLLVIHLMIAAALVGVVLIQRSEGGGLGMGGGGGGNFMTGRGTANLLTRITAALATGFFLTSLLLSILAGGGSKPASILDKLSGQGSSAPATSGTTTGGTTTDGGTGGTTPTTGGTTTTGGTPEPAAPSAPQSQ
jgi:preprotein translocase subunit SecG